MNFILSHPKSFISANLLMLFNGNLLISLDSLRSTYNKLDITIRNSLVGQEIKKDKPAEIKTLSDQYNQLT